MIFKYFSGIFLPIARSFDNITAILYGSSQFVEDVINDINDVANVIGNVYDDRVQSNTGNELCRSFRHNWWTGCPKTSVSSLRAKRSNPEMAKFQWIASSLCSSQ
jgi:hypothetical protein